MPRDEEKHKQANHDWYVKNRKGAGATWEEIGKEIGVSAQMAQQIYNHAMEKLRGHLKAKPELAETLYNFIEGPPDPGGYKGAEE
jgi:DNA-directed RNA polymerase sigma subunit (sigma70/sigma32)